MEYARRNVLTLATICLAFGAFAAELASALPEGVGVDLAKVSIVAIAAARGFVNAAAALKGGAE
jgi:hypothetical protein